MDDRALALRYTDNWTLPEDEKFREVLTSLWQGKSHDAKDCSVSSDIWREVSEGLKRIGIKKGPSVCWNHWHIAVQRHADFQGTFNPIEPPINNELASRPSEINKGPTSRPEGGMSSAPTAQATRETQPFHEPEVRKASSISSLSVPDIGRRPSNLLGIKGHKTGSSKATPRLQTVLAPKEPNIQEPRVPSTANDRTSGKESSFVHRIEGRQGPQMSKGSLVESRRFKTLPSNSLITNNSDALKANQTYHVNFKSPRWSHEEIEKLEELMQARRDHEQYTPGAIRWEGEKLFALISTQLQSYGINRTSGACETRWKRSHRAQTDDALDFEEEDGEQQFIEAGSRPNIHGLANEAVPWSNDHYDKLMHLMQRRLQEEKKNNIQALNEEQMSVLVSGQLRTKYSIKRSPESCMRWWRALGASGHFSMNFLASTGLWKNKRGDYWSDQELADLTNLMKEYYDMHKGLSQDESQDSMWEQIAANHQRDGYDRSADACRQSWKRVRTIIADPSSTTEKKAEDHTQNELDSEDDAFPLIRKRKKSSVQLGENHVVIDSSSESEDIPAKKVRRVDIKSTPTGKENSLKLQQDNKQKQNSTNLVNLQSKASSTAINSNKRPEDRPASGGGISLIVSKMTECQRRITILKEKNSTSGTRVHDYDSKMKDVDAQIEKLRLQRNEMEASKQKELNRQESLNSRIENAEADSKALARTIAMFS